MAKKPEPPPQLTTWSVLKIAKRAVWLSTIDPLSGRQLGNSKPRYGACTRCSDERRSGTPRLQPALACRVGLAASRPMRVPVLLNDTGGPGHQNGKAAGSRLAVVAA